MKQTSKPLPRLPPRKKKKAKRLEIEAAAIARGTELGKFQAHAKKPLLESFKMHMGEAINKIDPLEAIAIIGTTIIVHDTILTTEGLLKKAHDYGLSWTMGLDLSVPLSQWLGDILNLDTKKEKSPVDNWQLWLTSFALAFIIVRHAGALISGLTNFTGMASLLKVLM
jgi:hypothetical protein